MVPCCDRTERGLRKQTGGLKDEAGIREEELRKVVQTLEEE